VPGWILLTGIPFNKSQYLQVQVERFRQLIGKYAALVQMDKIYLTRRSHVFLKRKELAHRGATGQKALKSESRLDT
jgi:tryptophan synthase beta subunit